MDHGKEKHLTCFVNIRLLFLFCYFFFSNWSFQLVASNHIHPYKTKDENNILYVILGDLIHSVMFSTKFVLYQGTFYREMTIWQLLFSLDTLRFSACNLPSESMLISKSPNSLPKNPHH